MRRDEVREADRLAREISQREMRRPLVLEAGAGTGKTATLVARVLAWSLGSGWEKAVRRLARRVPASNNLRDALRDTREHPTAPDPHRVAVRVLRGVIAITFTEAAAGEMSQRLALALSQVRDGFLPLGFEPPEDLPDEERQERAAHLLAAADHLQVRTIHAFCRKLLAEHPFEAGLHPEFTVDADGAMRREILEEAVGEALVKGYGDPGDPHLLILARRGIGPSEIAEALDHLLGAGVDADELAADPLAPARVGELLEQLWDAVNRLQTLLETRRVAGTKARNAGAMLQRLGLLRRQLRPLRSAAPEAAVVRVLVDSLLPAPLIDHLAIWARGDTANQVERERLAGAFPRLAETADDLRRLVLSLRALDPELLGAARFALMPLLRKIQLRLRARGVVSFPDLLRGARRLVREHPALLPPLRARIDQLLVDEFQDTDVVQCDLVRALALEGVESQRPGLFVVGDPKQSIYGWREADLEAWESFTEDVLAQGGRRLRLSVSFRSIPAVLDEVGRLCEPVMKRRPGLQPAYAPLLPCRALEDKTGEQDDDGRRPIEHWISWLPDPDAPEQPVVGAARETAQLEARALADDLLALRRSGANWNDFGILLRSLTDLEIYLAALRDAGIPFTVSRDRQYYRRREILDAVALVRTVLVPEDRLALTTWLRCSIVGVPDAALLPLFTRGLPDIFARLRGDAADETLRLERIVRGVAAQVRESAPDVDAVRDWPESLLHAARMLAYLRELSVAAPADVFVQRLRDLTLFEALESSRYLGAYRRANLERFFAALLIALEEEAGDRHRVLRRLRRAIEQGEDADEAQPGGEDEETVRVMSIHKAKGLEFRSVYLLQTHKESGARGTPKIELGRVDDRLEYRFFGAPTLGFASFAARRDAVARAELARTLYVAATRARDRLIVAGRRPVGGEERKAPEQADTHLDLILHRSGETPSRRMLDEQWKEGRARADHHGVAWHLLAFSETQEPLEAAAADALVPVAVAERDHRELQALRREARDRQSERLRLSASGLATASKEAVVDRGSDHGARAKIVFGASDGEADDAEEKPLGRRREIATVAGTVVHQIFETFDLDADVDAEIERQRELLPGRVASSAGAALRTDVLERVRELFERLVAGGMLHRFAALGDAVVAREMPILLDPGELDRDAPGVVVGVIDLLYRDPQDGRFVVADYKTDRTDDPQALKARYAPQARAYCRAVEIALNLQETPRFELWALESQQVI